MNIFSKKNFLIFTLSIVCGASLIVAMPAHSRDAEPDQSVSASLSSLRGQIDKAVLIVAPRPAVLSLNRGLKEKDLPEHGCTYELSDSVTITALMDILSGGEFTENHGNLGQGLLMGIYLYGRDGSRSATFLFGQAFDDGWSRATYNGHPFIAKAPLERNIRLFVAGIQPTIGNSLCEPSDKPYPQIGAHVMPSTKF